MLMFATAELGLTYVCWHYTLGCRDFFSVWRNFLSFAYNYFAIPHHARSLFAPFRRLNETRQGFGLTPFFEVLIINTLMRAVGFVFRAVTICVGLGVLLLVSIVGVVAFALWLVLPLVLVGLLFASYKLLLS